MPQCNTRCCVTYVPGPLFSLQSTLCHVLSAQLSAHKHGGVAKETVGQYNDPVTFTVGYRSTDISGEPDAHPEDGSSLLSVTTADLSTYLIASPT